MENGSPWPWAMPTPTHPSWPDVVTGATWGISPVAGRSLVELAFRYLMVTRCKRPPVTQDVVSWGEQNNQHAVSDRVVQAKLDEQRV